MLLETMNKVDDGLLGGALWGLFLSLMKQLVFYVVPSADVLRTWYNFELCFLTISESVTFFNLFDLIVTRLSSFVISRLLQIPTRVDNLAFSGTIAPVVAALDMEENGQSEDQALMNAHNLCTAVTDDDIKEILMLMVGRARALRAFVACRMDVTLAWESLCGAYGGNTGMIGADYSKITGATCEQLFEQLKGVADYPTAVGRSVWPPTWLLFSDKQKNESTACLTFPTAERIQRCATNCGMQYTSGLDVVRRVSMWAADGPNALPRYNIILPLRELTRFGNDVKGCKGGFANVKEVNTRVVRAWVKQVQNRLQNNAATEELISILIKPFADWTFTDEQCGQAPDGLMYVIISLKSTLAALKADVQIASKADEDTKRGTNVYLDESIDFAEKAQKAHQSVMFTFRQFWMCLVYLVLAVVSFECCFSFGCLHFAYISTGIHELR